MALNRIQDSFVGGMTPFLLDESKWGGNTYPIGVNIRVRNNIVTPVGAPAHITNSQWLNVQGHTTIGDWHVVVSDGFAWVRNTLTQSYYTKLLGYQLNPNAARVYFASVPLSTQSYIRTLTNSNVLNGTTLSNQIPRLNNQFYNAMGGGLSCLVVQDGSSKPMLVHPNFYVNGYLCRAARDYADWTPENPEYVPIGTLMHFSDGRLWILLADADANRDKILLARSVTGRALDFMVIINQDGSKKANELEGNAAAAAHTVDFDPVTCISPMSASRSSFLVGTSRNTWIVTPNYDGLLPYGEPLFTNTFVAQAGIKNQNSTADANGDTVFISNSGIRSFNAASQTQREGANTPFSYVVSTLTDGIEQDSAACAKFNDYLIFALKTKYGYGLVVYDETLARWVSLDLNALWNNRPADFAPPSSNETNTGIIEFASVETPNNYILFALTADHKILQLFSTTPDTAQIYIGDYASGAANVEIKPTSVHLSFVQNYSTTNVSIITVVDNRRVTQGNFTLPLNTSITPGVYQSLPFGDVSADNDQTLSFNLDRQLQGYRVGFWVTWNGNNSLSRVAFTAEELPGMTTIAQRAAQFVSFSGQTPV